MAATAGALSATYRSGGPAPSLDDPSSAAAYAVSRMPATFAAAARAMAWTADRAPSFAPDSLLDVGAGTGASAWAARAIWPSLRTAALIDRAGAVVDRGGQLAAASGDEILAAGTWRIVTLPGKLPRADLVTAGYLLGEIDEGLVGSLVDRLWAATLGMLVLVEPGTRAGYGRIIAARDRLLDAGAHIVAPCPGPAPCPVAGSRTAWCHFLARLERSPSHRRAKRATRSWEDEPFSYVAVARPAVIADPEPRVVLGRPRHRPGRVALRICDDGRIETRIVSRRAGAAWRRARDREWGDALERSD